MRRQKRNGQIGKKRENGSRVRPSIDSYARNCVGTSEILQTGHLKGNKNEWEAVNSAHVSRQEVAGRMRAAYFQHMLCFVSVLVALWPFSGLFGVSTGNAARLKYVLLAFEILPCNPLAGVKHLVCSKARATDAPLSTLVMEST